MEAARFLKYDYAVSEIFLYLLYFKLKVSYTCMFIYFHAVSGIEREIASLQTEVC